MAATFDQLIIGITIASFAVFQFLFHFGSSWLSAIISLGFRSLGKEQKIEWNSRVASTVHALLAGVFGLYIFCFDYAVNADPVWGDATLVRINVAITAGYLISDLQLILWYWKIIGDVYFIMHHVAVLYAYYYVLSQGLLPYFANFRLLAEFSTPCVNQRWFFEVLGYSKSSKLNIINGLTMTIMFFLVRIAVMPVYYNQMVSTFGTEGFNRIGRGPQCVWIICSVSLDILNIMWMVKIARGCYKVFYFHRKIKINSQDKVKLQ
ncbi:TLC domain-containing protein 4-B-like [Protopterus annectens]|uniref:TLC domain-containing protein 4-B-like n=1 Tax=Protopterus annectens TaxID=7888 RepID=UPI001CFBE6FB|nr:TLC domain-containing protein 4-B-like [Protopterus annectens]